jgi:hypothetical protein
VNPWGTPGVVICSLDFAKRGEIRRRRGAHARPQHRSESTRRIGEPALEAPPAVDRNSARRRRRTVRQAVQSRSDTWRTATRRRAPRAIGRHAVKRPAPLACASSPTRRRRETSARDAQRLSDSSGT